jgi:predicted dehydrogenase
MLVGVIGYGSIGKRHCRNLIDNGIENITLFRESGSGNDLNLEEIYDFDTFLNITFDFIIISNPTSLHFKYLKILLEKNINVFIEKPIVSNWLEYEAVKELVKNYSGFSMVAYNMRFHPVVMKVKNILEQNQIGKVYSTRFFVGQYLPDWRPNTDYRKSYSSINEMGGGVILDLSHEIDMARFLFGEVKSCFHAISTKISNLEIDTEDIAEIHYKSESNVIVSIHLDYLVRGYSRHFEIIGENARIIGDLSNNSLKVIGYKNKLILDETFSDFDRNNMYFDLISYYLENFKSDNQVQLNLNDGLETLKIALMTKKYRNEN